MVQSNIKMIVTDLDRTLLRDDKTISGYTAQTLARCRDKGVKLVFATARYFRTVEEWILPTIGIHPDVVISSNGAYAYSGDKVLYRAIIGHKIANQIIAEIHKRGGQITAGTSRIRLSERVIEETHFPFSVPCDFQAPVTDDVHYIDYRGGSSVGEAITKSFPQIRLQSYVDSLTTFVHKDARKGIALSEIMQLLNLSSAHVAGFGDDVNDLDFLEVCGTKIAVANAIDEVKAVADYICDTNENDGVAKWLEEHVL